MIQCGKRLHRRNKTWRNHFGTADGKEKDGRHGQLPGTVSSGQRFGLRYRTLIRLPRLRPLCSKTQEAADLVVPASRSTSRDRCFLCSTASVDTVRLDRCQNLTKISAAECVKAFTH